MGTSCVARVVGTWTGAMVEAARSACPQLAAICAAQWEPCGTRYWQFCDDGWTVHSTTRGGWQGSRAMKVMFVVGLEFHL